MKHIFTPFQIPVATLVLFVCGLAIQARAQSGLDGFDPNTNGSIRAVVVQPDGKILIGGEFTTIAPNGGPPVTRNHIARLNADGTLDPFFNPSANDVVFAIAVQQDGKVLVGGFFSGANSIGGKTRNHIARLDAITGQADSFDPNANGAVFTIVVQMDGRILVGGDFAGAANSIGGQFRSFIARLDPATGLADSFAPDANGVVSAIALQSDGMVLAGGYFMGIGGQPRNYLARLDPVTGLADSFDPNANNPVYTVAVQADGKILVGGNFSGPNSIGGQTRNHIARLSSTDGLADSFDPNANSDVLCIALQTDGNILIGGDFSGVNSIGGQTRNHIARLNPGTGLADSFDPNANFDVRAIAVQPDDKILVGGDFNNLAPNGGSAVMRHQVARLELDGSLDRTLDPMAIDGDVFATAIQADGKILIGGDFTKVLGVARKRIARFNPDGTLDAAFDPGASGPVFSIVAQPNGKILVGGSFNGASSIGGQTRNYIARLDATTGLADSFDPNANNPVSSIVIQADGRILVGGQFSGTNSIGGQTRNYLARLDPTSGLADSFNPNANGVISAIAIQADGKILVGGNFSGPNSIGGQTRNHIARLNVTNGLADSFNPNANSDVSCIVLQPDGKILVGGVFGDGNGPISIGGQTRNRIARLDPASGLADSFDPNANGQVGVIALQADGKILVGGSFTPPPSGNNIGGQRRNFIARLDGTSGLADSFDPVANSAVDSIALQPDGKILAGGAFVGINSLGNQDRNHFGRLSNDVVAFRELAVTRESVVWVLGGSSPQFSHVTFEYSTDNSNYAFLGKAAATGNNWTLNGLNLPSAQNLYIRARGYHATGFRNASQSITQSVRNVFLSSASPTPSPTPTASPAATATATATPAATPTATPTATVTPTSTPTATVTPTSTPTATPTATPGLVGNVSTRLPVGIGENVLIEGFIVQGPVGSTKKILVRAIGPSLLPFGITDALANPNLEIHDSSGATVATNNDWRNTQVGGLITGDQSAQINGSGLAPGNDLESTVIVALAPGSYTAVVSGVDNGTGTGVVDAYDISASSPVKLANIATRGLIQAGDKLMIAGFIVQNAPVKAVVRAIGPSLLAFGINNALADTTLQLRDQNGALVREDDDWRSDQEQELKSIGLQPSDNREAALVQTIPPGQYTAQVRGKNDSSGIGVVQVYFLQ